jgi:transcription antitermination factor NusG
MRNLAWTRILSLLLLNLAHDLKLTAYPFIPSRMSKALTYPAKKPNRCCLRGPTKRAYGSCPMTGIVTSSSWGVLVALHQCQRIVGESLAAKRIEHFIPMIERQRIVRGKCISVLHPLFGRYVLVTINSIWREMKSMRGVAGMLVNEKGFPAQVLPKEVERIRQLCPENVYKENVIQFTGFVYGQRVTPKTGPLAFHVGKFDSSRSSGESAIFTLFGQEQKVIFRKGDLISAENDGLVRKHTRPSRKYREAHQLVA